jgi:hypothetical protein
MTRQFRGWFADRLGERRELSVVEKVFGLLVFPEQLKSAFV